MLESTTNIYLQCILYWIRGKLLNRRRLPDSLFRDTDRASRRRDQWPKSEQLRKAVKVEVISLQIWVWVHGAPKSCLWI
jgi:hypothetical protein